MMPHAGITPQMVAPWARAIACKSSVPKTRIAPIKPSPIAISNEIICAEPRIAPRSDQRLFVAQPPRTTPSTESPDIASTYRMPTFSSATWRLISRPPITMTSPNGTAANVTSTGNTARNGPKKCKSLSAPSGITSSFVNILIGSAISVFTMPRLNDRMPPKMLARLAPMRSWMSALPLRSTHKSRTVRLSTRSSITSDLTAAIAASAHTRRIPLLALASAQRFTRSIPGERALLPHVREPGREHADEDEHLDEPGHAETAEDDRPGIQEHDLDVEHDEENGDEIESHREATARGTGRRIAALEHLLLHRTGMVHAENHAGAAHDADDHRGEPERDDDAEILV